MASSPSGAPTASKHACRASLRGWSTGISQYRLAQATGLPQTRISEIVRGKRSITTDTALRLSKALGVDERFWINIQTDYDLEVERDLRANELADVTVLVAH